MFLSTSADIAIYGGAAGGGKTWAALYEPLRHKANPDFEAVIFRRTRPQIKQPGGLLSESSKFYPSLGAGVNLTELIWQFRSGMRIRLAQLQHEKTKFEWQGSQIALAIFDELTHFSEGQFFYIVSRMRSTCGVRPYMRATCNADSESWVATFIAWWIDPDTGLPILERSGVLRYFVRDGDTIVWGNSIDELRALVPQWTDAQFKPKSVTFIAARVYDNPALLKADPDYLANLFSLPLVIREQLLGGNWKIRAAAGLLFKERWFGFASSVPPDAKMVRWWDIAATVAAKGKSPDWTVGLLMARTREDRFIVVDVIRFRGSPHEVQSQIVATARADVARYGKRVAVGLPTDPAAGGKFQVSVLTRSLAGYDVRTMAERGAKVERFRPYSAQVEAGNVDVMAGDWNKDFFIEHEAVPKSQFDDQVDAGANALQMLTESKSKKLRSF